jgi:uncharacterized membrane protein
MGEKKLVNRNIVIAIAVVCIILIIGLAGVASMLVGKDSQIATQNSKIATQNLKIDSLQTQVTNLTAPNLVWSPFGVTFQAGFFMISGFGCNTGTQTAYNVRLNVVAYSVAGPEVIDSYMSLGTIAGKQVVDISNGTFRQIYYGGGALNSNWTITPSWSATP